MSACVYSVCAVLRGGSGLAAMGCDPPPSKECGKGQETEKSAKARQRAVEL
jgi:hypothetical protein